MTAISTLPLLYASLLACIRTVRTETRSSETMPSIGIALQEVNEIGRDSVLIRPRRQDGETPGPNRYDALQKPLIERPESTRPRSGIAGRHQARPGRMS